MIAINNSLPAFNFNNQPQIYVACLAAYNNGRLHGIWIDATQEVEEISKKVSLMLAKSSEPGAEKYVIYDQKELYDLEIEKDESIEDIQEKALFIVEHGELGTKLLNYYRGNLEHAQEAMEPYGYYHGEYESELDYATEFFDETYLPEVPTPACFYIAYDRFKRDIFINDFFSIEVGGKKHIFSRH